MLSSKVGTISVAAIAGALLPLAFAPFDLWPLAFVSMATLWIAQKSEHRIFATLSFGFMSYLVGIHWVYVSMAEFSGIHPIIAGSLVTLMAAACTLLFFGPLAFAYKKLAHRLSPLSFSLIWVLAESTRNWLFTGFPWLMVGYSQTDTWLSGYAPIGGVTLVSFVVVFASASFCNVLRSHHSTRFISVVCATLLLTISPWLSNINYTEPADHKRVLLVQPNVDQNYKWDPRRLQGYKRDLVKLTVDHLKDTDLVIWPEAAVPELARNARPYLNRVHELAKQTRTQIITGVPMYSEGEYYNAAVAIGGQPWEYKKTRLVPFGEYIPLETITGTLFKILELPNESQASGTLDQPPLVLDDVRVALNICYEVAFSGIVAHQARSAEMLATISNDGWFGRSIGPAQHMQMAQMRAIENQKPMLRSTNNGISGVIDHRGRIIATQDVYVQTVITADVEPRQGLTPFTYTGNWIVVIGALLLLLTTLLLPRRTSIDNAAD